MNYASIIDCTYLPDNLSIDTINTIELNEAYQFASRFKFRSFCTYLNLLPFITNYDFNLKICSVIDFPDGTKSSYNKLFEAGKCYELCKFTNSSEIDIVLNPNKEKASEDIKCFNQAKINDKIGIKYIIELGLRPLIEIEELLSDLTNLPICKYIKTNTGKKITIPHTKKLELCKVIKSMTILPIKISGGINNIKEIDELINTIGDDAIFGVSYNKLKTWGEI